MSNDVLSFRDFDPGAPTPAQRRLLYKPAFDDEFDAAMVERRAEDGGDAAEAATTGPGFGTNVEIDDELLQDLVIPPRPPLHRGFARELRPTAIFLTSRLFGLLPTASILRWASSLGVRDSDGLEWISDWSLVLVFHTREASISAFKRILLHPDEIEGENGMEEAFDYLTNPETDVEVLEAAGDFVLTHRPVKPLTAPLFTKNPLPSGLPPQDLLPFARFALFTDVKSSDSRKSSMWYAVHGDDAGKEGMSMKRTIAEGRKRGREEDALDAQMDAYRAGKALDGPRSDRPVKGLPKRARGKVVVDDQSRAAQLDDELDRFMRRGADGDADGVEAKHEDDSSDDRRKKRRSAPDLMGIDDDATTEGLLRHEAGGDVGEGASWTEPAQRAKREPEEEVVEEVEVVDEETGEKVKKVTRSRRRGRRRLELGSLFARLS